MEYQEDNQNKGLSYLSIIGSTVSLICFFCPWIGCAGSTISGSQIGDEFWLVFASSAISFIAFLIFKSQKNLAKAKNIIIACSAFGICFLLYKYIKIQNNEMGRAFEIKWGGIGTMCGFILSLIGVPFLKNEVTDSINNSTPGIYCSNCGKKYSVDSEGKYCDECGTKL